MRHTLYHLHRKAGHFSFDEFMKRRGMSSLIFLMAWLTLIAVLYFKYGS